MNIADGKDAHRISIGLVLQALDAGEIAFVKTNPQLLFVRKRYAEPRTVSSCNHSNLTFQSVPQNYNRVNIHLN